MKPSEAKDLQAKIFKDRLLRAKVTSQSHQWFFSTYFASYLTHPSANHHRDLFAISEDQNLPLAIIVAFRGSGKSTIMTLSYPIWAVLGKLQKKFVLIASQTQYQARVHLTNIKRELEGNELLSNDLGPFVEQREEWGSTSLYIPRYNARITAISTEQSVRGIRHGQYRPDLIICDDVEDMNSVKTREGRNKTFDWFTGEIIPAGDTYTKRIVVGNLLHEDCLLMRLKEKLEADEIDGIFRQWPIMKDGKSLWPGKYPDEASLTVLKRTIGNKIAWEREFMLRIVADEDQIIDPAWIHFYDELPEMTGQNQYINTFLGVDLAISEKTSADFTTVVPVHAYGYKPEDRRYYIDPHFINKRLSFMQTCEAIEQLYKNLKVGGEKEARILVEDVGYQASMVEALKDLKLKVKGVKIKGDKHTRLMAASMLFERGKVFFPKDRNAKEIVSQLLGFGVEKHDDLVDATTLALNYIQTKVEYGMLACFYPYDEENTIYTIRYKD
jgi:predicted phage terminase large subunit-like protein